LPRLRIRRSPQGIPRPEPVEGRSTTEARSDRPARQATGSQPVRNVLATASQPSRNVCGRLNPVRSRGWRSRRNGCNGFRPLRGWALFTMSKIRPRAAKWEDKPIQRVPPVPLRIRPLALAPPPPPKGTPRPEPVEGRSASEPRSVRLAHTGRQTHRTLNSPYRPG